MPLGRPPQPVPQDKADYIVEQLCAGRSLRSICKDEGMPTPASVIGWAEKDDAFAKRYARAQEIGCEMLADEILDIADEAAEDSVEEQRRKCRVDARKWILSKRHRTKFGDRLNDAPKDDEQPNPDLRFL